MHQKRKWAAVMTNDRYGADSRLAAFLDVPAIADTPSGHRLNGLDGADGRLSAFGASTIRSRYTADECLTPELTLLDHLECLFSG